MFLCRVRVKYRYLLERRLVVHGETGLGDVTAPSSLDYEAIKKPAYQFIIDSVRAEPREITLVAVGPLTNLALALEAAPDIVDLVKEVVVIPISSISGCASANRIAIASSMPGSVSRMIFFVISASN